MNKKNGFRWIIFPIIGCLLLLGCNSQRGDKSDAATEQEIDELFEQCNQMEDSESKGWCLVAGGAKLKDPRFCDKIETISKNDRTKDMCYVFVVNETRDISTCDKVQDMGYKGSCYGLIAQDKKDATICEQIPFGQQRDQCLKSVALAKKDPAICDLASDSIYTGKDDCYLDVAMAIKQITICEKISDIRDKEWCLDNVGKKE